MRSCERQNTYLKAGNIFYRLAKWQQSNGGQRGPSPKTNVKIHEEKMETRKENHTNHHQPGDWWQQNKRKGYRGNVPSREKNPRKILGGLLTI